MQPDMPTTSGSNVVLWTGRVLSALLALFFLADAIGKFVKPDFVVKTTVELGYVEEAIVPLGVTLLVSTLFYVVPQTAVLGAILLTGYLGGAVASHLRHGDGPSVVLAPAIFGALVWTGIGLRDARLRALIPFRKV